MSKIRRFTLMTYCCAIVLGVLFLFCSFAVAQEAPVFAWERDVHNHWQMDQQGQSINLGEHVLDDAMICSVCGSEVVAYDDGSGDVGNYDEHGNFVHGTSFDAEGAVTYDSRHILSYDENGVLVLDLEYINGVFFGENTFTADAEGNAIPVKQIAYYEDGTTSVNEYDQYGNCVASKSYEADGTLSVEILSEYALDDDGWYYEAKSTTRFSEGEVFYREYNQYCDEVMEIYTYADGTVWHNYTFEYEYANGCKVWMKAYDDGVLERELFFDEFGITTKEIEYEEDGSFTTIIYDENEW